MSLIEESDESHVTAHVNGSTIAIGHQGAVTDAIGHQATAAADGKLTFAGATSAAAAKAVANATTAFTAAKKVDAATSVGGKTTAKQPLAALGWFAWIRMTMSMGFVVKSMCMLSNVFYQASPLPVVNAYSGKGDTGDADLAPFIALAFSGWQWCFYGTFAFVVTGKSGFLVLVYSNVVGATLGLYYVYSFICHCKNRGMIEKSTKYYYILFCLVVIQMTAIATMPGVKALFLSGIISSAWSTVTSCSLLVTVPTVYETKNSQSLPQPLLIMGLFSAMLWIVCGLMLWDPWITFPNTISICVCTYALHLCFKFPPKESCSTPEIYEAYPADAEDGHMIQNGVEERSSPALLQRALDYVSRSSMSEGHSLQESADSASKYGSVVGGTGGTGDSW
jgi:uncharacterized protein with PQ loop repeat